MITGTHVLLFAHDADAARAFLRDVIGFPSVDSGGGWLIFAVPPADLGVHPGADTRHQVSFACDDIHATVRDLESRGVVFTRPVEEHSWGWVTTFSVPGAGEVELYQPKYDRPV